MDRDNCGKACGELLRISGERWITQEWREYSHCWSYTQTSPLRYPLLLHRVIHRLLKAKIQEFTTNKYCPEVYMLLFFQPRMNTNEHECLAGYLRLDDYNSSLVVLKKYVNIRADPWRLFCVFCVFLCGKLSHADDAESAKLCVFA